MKKYWIGVFGQTTALLKRISRDMMALFFTFLFPLLFLFIFGSVFSNDSSDLKVAVFNHSPTALAKSFVKILKEGKNTGIKVVSQVSTVDKSHSDDDLTMAQAKEKMKRSSIDGIPAGAVTHHVLQNAANGGRGTAVKNPGGVGTPRVHFTTVRGDDPLDKRQAVTIASVFETTRNGSC